MHKKYTRRLALSANAAVPVAGFSSVQNPSEWVPGSAFEHELKVRLDAVGLPVKDNGVRHEMGS